MRFVIEVDKTNDSPWDEGDKEDLEVALQYHTTVKGDFADYHITKVWSMDEWVQR